MYVKITYDPDFEDLYMHLKSKYPKKLLDLEGIGKQTDMSQFSKEFFSAKTAADVSVDSNANVDDMSVIAYEKELPKSFFRLNSHYLLWKYTKQLYGLEFANKVVEMQLTGDVYINDFHGYGISPYSYHKDTSLILKINGEVIYTTMEQLFENFNDQVEKLPDREQINLQNLWLDKNLNFGGIAKYNKFNHQKKVFLKEKYTVEVLDEDNKWTKVKYIIRHKPHNQLLKINTKNGLCTIVTEDHPVILANNTIKKAKDLEKNDCLKQYINVFELPEEIYVEEDFAYLIGFWLGDGYSTSKRLAIVQKDIKTHPIVELVNKYISYTESCSKRVVNFGGKQFYNYFVNELQMGKGAERKRLPNNILSWNKKSIEALICGLIDSDGTINPNGRIDIRVGSFSLTQQVCEVLKLIGVNDIRTSFVDKQDQQNKKIKTKLEMYRVSFRLTDEIQLKLSSKVNENRSICNKQMSKDGRWESNQIHYIKKYENETDWVYDITTETGQFYCQGLIQHNCFNFSTYDVMNMGLPFVSKIKSSPPKHLSSFMGQMGQFITYASNSVLGAVGLADIFIIMSYYVKKILESNMYTSEEVKWKIIKQELQSFIYTVNQPFRGGLQSAFTNCSVMDKYFLENLCPQYEFPDGSYPDIELVQKLQVLYLDLINEELRRTPVTFPVTTACFSVDHETRGIRDKEFLRLIAEKNREFGFINIYTGETSTLSSCCRLRSSTDLPEYFNSFGAGSSKIGSLSVVTMNIPRVAYKSKNKEEFIEQFKEIVWTAVKINHAKRTIIKKRIENGNLPLYGLGFMDLKKQYSTAGILGLYEALQILGYDILTKEGQDFVHEILDIVNKINAEATRRYGYPHNQEQVPAESSSVKLASKDRCLGYQDQYEFYSNQFIPLIANADLLDRIKLQGEFDAKMSGGAICHLNVEQQIEDIAKIENLIETASKMGVVYFAINYNLQRCSDNHISVGKKETCWCGKPITENYTRVVGFLTSTKHWNQVRREHDYPNRVFYEDVV
ncbi:MAG TPA: hypothetical protein GX708_06075 [Gallicola sp.]|nr:hypothetical protein [Gallicola sp.]